MIGWNATATAAISSTATSNPLMEKGERHKRQPGSHDKERPEFWRARIGKGMASAVRDIAG